jgi:hypothetical protein
MNDTVQMTFGTPTVSVPSPTKVIKKILGG